MSRVLTYLTAVLVLATAFSHPAWAGSPEVGGAPQSLGTYHLTVDPSTGSAALTDASGGPIRVLAETSPDGPRLSSASSTSFKPPRVGTKTVKLSAGEPVAGGISANAVPLQQPYLSSLLIRNKTNLVDKDNDGYYAFFNFNLGIGVRTSGQSQTVMATIRCNPTGQMWLTDPWTITPTQETFVDIPFDRTDFLGGALRGLLTTNTNLYFIVDLYDATQSIKYSTKTTSEPFRADPVMYPYIVESWIYQLNPTADEDHDGYASHYNFGIAFLMDTDRDTTYSVNLFVYANDFRRYWYSEHPVTVPDPGGYFWYMPFSEVEVNMHWLISGNTKLDFTVKIADAQWKDKPDIFWDTATNVVGEPVLVDPVPLQIAEAGIAGVDRLRDEDGDGFYSQYDFDLGIRAETPTTCTVAARISCTTTGQIWDVPAWTILPGREFWQEVHFDETNFAGILSGNTELYFRVDLYDGEWKTLVNSTSNIAGQPFPVDPVKAPDDAYALVRHFYNAALGREPEPGAVDAWINGYFLYSLYSEIDVRFIGREMGRIFFFSQEYANRKRDNAGFIRDCYQAFLWRDPSQAELSAWLAGIWDRTQALTIFSESEEFGDLMSVRWFPGYEGKPIRNFVTTMYVGFLDRLPDCGGLDSWSDEMERAADKRQASKDMALAILHSAEYRARKDSTGETVTRLYRAIMGRFPGSKEVDYWALEITSGRRTVEQVVETFCNTQEFTNRLYQYFG